MWDETLIESKRKKNGKRWLGFPLSLVAHALVISLIIGISYWTVEAVQTPAPIPSIKIFVPQKLPSDSGGASAIHKADLSNNHPQPTPNGSAPVIIPIPERQNIPIEAINPGPPSNIVDAESIGSGPGVSDNGPGGNGHGDVPGGNPDQPVVINSSIKEPELIKKVEPIYPRVAILGHIQGFVIMEAVISKSGNVEDLKSLRSDNPLLEAAAIAAVKQWQYKPAMLNSRPISVYFTVTVDFKIK